MKREQTKTASLNNAQHVLNDPRWLRLIHRDREADGTFVYAVSSTGVFCRPACASRTPRPENVRFFSSPDEAIRAGFRPCKRCQPIAATAPQPKSDLVEAVCAQMNRAIATGDRIPTLDDLAAVTRLSRFHLQRTFREATGMSPRQYAAFQRAKRVQNELRENTTVTDAIYNAGYNSSSHFYSEAKEALGMQPSHLQSGGKDTTIRYAVGRSPLGLVLAAQSERGICAILMGDNKKELVADLKKRFARATLIEAGDDFTAVLNEVIALATEPQQAKLRLPLDMSGTLFQQRVWKALRSIPAGKTATYRQIAEKLGSPRAVRAVAGACAANHIAIAIPCHRVVRNDGSLSGYRWGVERKTELLRREGAR